jgi:outer membrane protein assembly factor BamA
VDGVQLVRAQVTVEEYPPWRLRYGVQVDREQENRESESVDQASRFTLRPGVIGEVRNQNVFGRAITAGVATRLELDFQRVNTFLQNASFFGLPLRTGLFLYASSEDLKFDGETVAVEQLRGISLEQRWRRRRGVEITYGYRYEFNHTYNPNALPDDPFAFQDSRVARLTLAGLFDRRDDPADSHRGTFSSAAFDQASTWLGSDTSYRKILAQQFAFWTTGPVVLASRAIGGTTQGSDDPTDRFQAGGATTVRGYAENSLGARDTFGDVLGGDQLLILNQELRFPIYRWLRGVAFVDAGNAFSELEPFAFRDLAVGYGAGLRLNSPIGVLRLDFGIPATTISPTARRANEAGSGRWYFGLGHIF